MRVRGRNSALQRGIRASVWNARGAAAITLGFFLSASAWANNDPVTIDDLGFSSAMDDQLFSSDYELKSKSVLVDPNATTTGISLDSNMAFATEQQVGSFSGETSEGQGIDIKRFSTALTSSAGTLTVGSDWSNFQDFLADGSTDSGVTAEQIRWDRGGFSIALEGDALIEGSRYEENTRDLSSLVLSWQGADDRQRGQYSFSALGKQLSLEEGTAGNDEDIGWGLNLAGGWQFGDLFAALSVTLGNSIDGFILGRLGEKESASASLIEPTGQSLTITPSINYRLSDRSNVHVSLNRFEASGEASAHGIDTLDTIHLGYTWTPWPSTRIGIEFVGKEMESGGDSSDSSAVNFAASKRF